METIFYKTLTILHRTKQCHIQKDFSINRLCSERTAVSSRCEAEMSAFNLQIILIVLSLTKISTLSENVHFITKKKKRDFSRLLTCLFNQYSMWNPYIPFQRHYKYPLFILEKKGGGMNFEMQYYVTNKWDGLYSWQRWSNTILIETRVQFMQFPLFCPSL